MSYQFRRSRRFFRRFRIWPITLFVALSIALAMFGGAMASDAPRVDELSMSSTTGGAAAIQPRSVTGATVDDDFASVAISTPLPTDGPNTAISFATPPAIPPMPTATPGQ